MKSLFAIIGTTLLYPVALILLLITLRLFVECRFVPSSAMKPAVAVNDRIMLEKVTTLLGKPYARGEIVIFYPPPSEMGGKDLSWDVMHVLERFTGLPFAPYEPAFVKRVIGLPGEHVQIVSGQGIFINGKSLDETDYLKEQAQYSLTTLVPPGELFVLGDNRNNSEDSHVFGTFSVNRVIGCAMLKFYPALKVFDLPNYQSK